MSLFDFPAWWNFCQHGGYRLGGKDNDMRIQTMLLLGLVLSACAAPPAVPTTEEGRQAEAEQLVRYSLTDRIMASVEKNFVEMFAGYLVSKQVPAGQADALVREEFAAIMADEEQRLLDALVPIYRRYYTAEEIHQLLSFYRTEVARKSIQVSGQIAAEGQQFVRLWNGNFEQALLERVKARSAEAGITIE
jgi:hypothetical protein